MQIRIHWKLERNYCALFYRLGRDGSSILPEDLGGTSVQPCSPEVYLAIGGPSPDHKPMKHRLIINR